MCIRAGLIAVVIAGTFLMGVGVPVSPFTGTATDGQALVTQSASVQVLYLETHGALAPTQWVIEHHAALRDQSTAQQIEWVAVARGALVTDLPGLADNVIARVMVGSFLAGIDDGAPFGIDPTFGALGAVLTPDAVDARRAVVQASQAPLLTVEQTRASIARRFEIAQQAAIAAAT